jgi:pyruvate ferredoxin oxidoreductase delta subunit
MSIEKKKGWKEIPLAGVCWVSSTSYLTGDWKTYRPIWDSEKCTRCMLCHIYCPDGAISWRSEKDEMIFNYDYCKGCGICANECPVDAITMRLEGTQK